MELGSFGIRMRLLIIGAALYMAICGAGAQPESDLGQCGPSYEYGHYALRPYERGHYLVWVFDALTSEANYWAGWGPPPEGWTNRPDIPHQVNEDGTWTYHENANPWPPAAPYESPVGLPPECLGANGSTGEYDLK